MGLMEEIISLAKRRGFVYSGSEIYGGLANTYDYGPLGVELLRNIQNLWWDRFVLKRPEIYGIHTSILMNRKVWEASGHVKNFVDPLVECLDCHKRFRFDHLENKNKCPECGGKLTPPKMFQGMFRTYVGATEDKGTEVFLRPETAQGMFVNFKNVIDSIHPKIPFGLAQIGKGFRNEITLGNFIFRTLEFDMMEIEYFIEEKDWEKTFEEWRKEMWQWLIDLGVSHNKLSWREHSAQERAHYSKRTEDIEYEFPFGKSELYGLAYRGDYDLRNHSEKSGVELKYTTPDGRSFYPHVVEPTFGANRTFLTVLLESYHKDEKRVYLKLDPKLAPYKVAVFPLLANKENLVNKALEIYNYLLKFIPAVFDDRGNIGKRYFAQDEIGTPWCVTVDFETLEDKKVTIRDRDTMDQERVLIDNLKEYFLNKLE
ncbi:MAG: glycine--tRNA ligase [Patescibacteria group bacterium]|nr:MAG: glycine--tRNA ligase [Patescibacteria group bacterium]